MTPADNAAASGCSSSIGPVGRSLHGAGGCGWAVPTARSSHSASAWRAMRQAASEASAAMRAASDSRVRRSSRAPMVVAAVFSRFAVTAAVRAAVLTSLMSTSQSRAAASASSVDWEPL